MASRTQFRTVSMMEMGKTWFLWCSFSFGFFFFFFLTNECCFALVVGGGGFHDKWDLGSQEILPSLRTLTYEVERILNLPTRP